MLKVSWRTQSKTECSDTSIELHERIILVILLVANAKVMDGH